MSYSLFWNSPALPFVQKKIPIIVGPGATNSSSSSLTFTGKGATNYGKIQQENLIRLLESFAGPTPPIHPTVGQTWYNTTTNSLNVCISTPNTDNPNGIIWQALGGLEIGALPPVNVVLGTTWFQTLGTASGILYVFTGVGRYPQTGNSIGGWEQVWPPVNTVGGRDDYDYMLGLLNELLDSSAGGSGAKSTSMTEYFTNFAALDASLQGRWVALGANTNIVHLPGDILELKLSPNSADWDNLLAVSKYAIDRLELPSGFASDVSEFPFVDDGRQINPMLQALNIANVRAPRTSRRTSRKPGTITLMRGFQETANVLMAAKTARYTLKGMLNTMLPSTVHTTRTVNVAANSFVSPKFIGLRWNFSSLGARTSFFTSAQAIEILLEYSGTNADMAAIVFNAGRIRITRDNTYVFGAAIPPVLSQQPSGLGQVNFTPAGVVTATRSVGGSSVSIRGVQNPLSNTDIFVQIQTPATDGIITVRWNWINDAEVFGTPTPTRAFPAPLPFLPVDAQIGDIFLP